MPSSALLLKMSSSFEMMKSEESSSLDEVQSVEVLSLSLEVSESELDDSEAEEDEELELDDDDDDDDLFR